MKKRLVSVISFLLMCAGIILGLSLSVRKEEEVISINTSVDDFIHNEEVKVENKNEEYFMALEIPSINLKRGIYEKGSYLNNVNLNILLLNESDTPDIENGTVILASHAGNMDSSYFRNLYKLYNGAKVYLYYEGVKYEYEIVNNYEVNKTGKVKIKRESIGNYIALITCISHSNKQIVFIGIQK